MQEYLDYIRWIGGVIAAGFITIVGYFTKRQVERIDDLGSRVRKLENDQENQARQDDIKELQVLMKTTMRDFYKELKQDLERHQDQVREDFRETHCSIKNIHNRVDEVWRDMVKKES